MWSHFNGDRWAKASSVTGWPFSRKADTARSKYREREFFEAEQRFVRGFL
jgi:hypothetical protein